MTLQNEKFEELITRQLTRELEPQRGRAAAAFQAQVAAEAAERVAAERAERIVGGSKNQESWARREVSRRGLWLWMGVPSLIAACLAVVVTLPFAGTKTVPPTDAGTMLVKDAPSVPEVLDEGVTGDKDYSGRLVGGMEIVPEKPSGGVLQDNQTAPQR